MWVPGYLTDRESLKQQGQLHSRLTFDQLENVWLTFILVTHCECIQWFFIESVVRKATALISDWSLIPGQVVRCLYNQELFTFCQFTQLFLPHPGSSLVTWRTAFTFTHRSQLFTLNYIIHLHNLCKGALSIKNHWMDKENPWSQCCKRNSLSNEGIFMILPAQYFPGWIKRYVWVHFSKEVTVEVGLEGIV